MMSKKRAPVPMDTVKQRYEVQGAIQVLQHCPMASNSNPGKRIFLWLAVAESGP